MTRCFDISDHQITQLGSPNTVHRALIFWAVVSKECGGLGGEESHDL